MVLFSKLDFNLPIGTTNSKFLEIIFCAVQTNVQCHLCASFNHTEQKLLLLLKKIVFLSFWLERIQFFIVEKAITTWLMIPAKKT